MAHLQDIESKNNNMLINGYYDVLCFKVRKLIYVIFDLKFRCYKCANRFELQKMFVKEKEDGYLQRIKRTKPPYNRII